MNYTAKGMLKTKLEGNLVPRKIVKVYLTPQQKNLVERICHSLGMDESELLRYAFMEFARSVGLVTEKILGKI